MPILMPLRVPRRRERRQHARQPERREHRARQGEVHPHGDHATTATCHRTGTTARRLGCVTYCNSRAVSQPGVLHGIHADRAPATICGKPRDGGSLRERSADVAAGRDGAGPKLRGDPRHGEALGDRRQRDDRGPRRLLVVAPLAAVPSPTRPQAPRGDLCVRRTARTPRPERAPATSTAASAPMSPRPAQLTLDELPACLLATRAKLSAWSTIGRVACC
jgi:hypothetical protein